MPVRNSRPVTVTLGEMTERAQARVHSGAYASLSEVLRAGLRALDREDAALQAVLRSRVEEALVDPQASRSAAEVFARLRAHHAQSVKACGP